MELRSKVEEEFQKRLQSSEELVTRLDVIGLLCRLGLEADEAQTFVDSWDPARKPKVSYKQFLDFIYGPDQVEASPEVRDEHAAVFDVIDRDKDGTITDVEIRQAVDEQRVEKACELPENQAVKEQRLEKVDNEQPQVSDKQMSCSTVLDSTVGQDSALVSQSLGDGALFKQEEVADDEPVLSASLLGSESREAPAEAVQTTANDADDEAIRASMEAREEEEEEDATPAPEAEPFQATSDGSDITLPNTAPPERCSLCRIKGRMFQDPTDLEWYCEQCWSDYYGTSPIVDAPLQVPSKLVNVCFGKSWSDSALQQKWAAYPIYGWPPHAFPATSVPAAGASFVAGEDRPKEVYVNVRVRVVPDLVGSHARESSKHDRPYLNEVLAGRYCIESVVGAGHFTRALLAKDEETQTRVCIKRHNGLTIELLTDLLAIGKRLEAVDPQAEYFPKLIEAFYDMSGYTVESLIEGRNCLELMREDPKHFTNMDNLRLVGQGVLKALSLLSKASIVHADVKSDNIMWTTDATTKEPRVRLVDFGCARLDRRIENGRNWALNEGGAGHLGKWTPEMVLRLPITDRSDVWGIAIALLELHCGRAMWSCEADTVEVILAQVLGLTNARDGLPVELLRRSPLDITKLYSPAPQYFPLKRTNKKHDAPLEELRPATWGLEGVLGKEESWDAAKIDFADYVKASLKLDHDERPSAEQLLSHPFLQGEPQSHLRTESPCPEECPEV